MVLLLSIQFMNFYLDVKKSLDFYKKKVLHTT